MFSETDSRKQNPIKKHKENKGESKDCFSPNKTPLLKLPTTRRTRSFKLPSPKKYFSENFSHAPGIAKVAKRIEKLILTRNILFF